MEKHFTKIANAVAYTAGKPATFIACVTIILVWAVTGPLFGFSDTWQLVVNTGTTIITFLMVFLIQNTQNRDATTISSASSISPKPRSRKFEENVNKPPSAAKPRGKPPEPRELLFEYVTSAVVTSYVKDIQV